MRISAIPIAALIVCPAAARAAPGEWEEITTIARVRDDGGRVGVGPLVGTGLGDGARRDTSAGVRAIYFATEDVAIGGELRDLAAGDPPHADLLGPARTSTASIDLGYRFATGKLASGDRVVRFDLLASAGAGAVWTDRAGGDVAHLAGTLGLSARVGLGDAVELELGFHDERYGASLTGALEARASLSILWPSQPRERCMYIHGTGRRNPLADQPAVRY